MTAPLLTSLEQAGEGSRLLLVDLNAAPFTRTFFDALNGYATGGSGRCLETLAIWNARLAASTPVGGWEDISTAPRDLVVQMYEPHSQGGFMFAGCIGIDGSYRDNLRGDALNPTHWMPLPEAPKGGEA